MAQYGLTKEVIESGDLRIMMAVEPANTENNKLFEAVRQFDDLIIIKEGTRPSLTYNLEAIGRYNNLQVSLKDLKPFTKDGIPVSGPCGMYARGTCILAGTSSNLNKEFIKTAKGYGIPVIGLGNICYTDIEPDFWIGRQDVLSYLPKPIETQRIQAFVLSEYLEEGLWDPMLKQAAKITPSLCVNTLGYSVSDTPLVEWLKDPQGISDFGFKSSLTAGISLAVIMGFHNIILTGVSLGGPVSQFFVYDEVPHADTVRRKAGIYMPLRREFDNIYRTLTEHGIRIVSVGDFPARVPTLPVQYLERALNSVLALTRRIDPKQVKVTLPADKKRRYMLMVRDNQSHIVTPPVLLDHAKELTEKAPQVFGTETVKKALAEYEAASRRPGGCTGCMKGKVGQPLYAAFEKGIQDGNRELIEAWKEVMPDQYILKSQLMRGTVVSEMIFREDKKDKEQEWLDGQI